MHFVPDGQMACSYNKTKRHASVSPKTNSLYALIDASNTHMDRTVSGEYDMGTLAASVPPPQKKKTEGHSSKWTGDNTSAQTDDATLPGMVSSTPEIRLSRLLTR